MQKFFLLITLFFFSPCYFFGEQLFYVETINVNDSRYQYFSDGIKAYLGNYLMQIPEYTGISDYEYKTYQEIKKVDISFSGSARFYSDKISIIIKMRQQGISEFKAEGKFSDIDKIIYSICQQIKTYLVINKLPKFGIIKIFESFKIHSQALLYLKNKPDIALSLLLKALTIDGNALPVYLDYIPLLIRLKKWRDAEKAVSAAIEISKKNKKLFLSHLFLFYQVQIKMKFARFWELTDNIEKVSRYFEKRGNLTLAFKSLLVQSELFRLINNPDKAKKFAEYAHKLIKNRLLDGYAAKETGAVFFASKNYSQALEKFNEAKNVFDKLNLRFQSLLCQANILSAYIVLGKTDDANKLAEKLLIEAKKRKSLKLLYISNYHLGELSFRKKEYPGALAFFNTAVLHSRNEGNFLGTLKTRFMIGRMLIKMNKYPDSLKEFLAVLNFSNRLKIDKLSAWSLYYIHLAYHKTKVKEKALQYLKQCVDFLGFTQDPALELMRKRLETIEKGKPVEDLNDDPIVAAEQSGESRRDRAIQQNVQPAGAGSIRPNPPVPGQTQTPPQQNSTQPAPATQSSTPATQPNKPRPN